MLAHEREVVLLGADSEEAIRVTHPTHVRDFDAEPFSLEEVRRRLPWFTPERTVGRISGEG